jgi:uncharacterized protein (DUF427 family)
MTKVLVKVGDEVIAESDATIKVEGNHYFPESSVNMSFLTPTDQTSVCHWKGNCNYYTITVAGQTLTNSAWTYHEPITERAMPIKDYIAFYPNQVTIEEV